MTEGEEIECYTGENKSEIPSVINCKQCVFETLCLAWNSKTQCGDIVYQEKTS
jgi:hypothetical protein